MSARPTLITGAAGLLGLAVARLLSSRGDEIIAVDRVAQEDLEGIRIQQCDLTDLNRMHELTLGGIGAVIHCGAYSGPMVARDQPYSMVTVNVLGTANALEVARIHSADRFVFCSSANAYGAVESDEPVTEDALPHPPSLYAASKIASEQLITAYADQYGVSGLSLRLGWVYGPRRTTDCVIRTMLEGALEDRPVRMPFGADFFRQFIHVDDAARALVHALDAEAPAASVYNVTGDSYTTLEEVAAIVRRSFPDADISLADGPDPLDIRQTRFDTSAARRDLGFTPSVPLEDGIPAYADWLRAS
jgi:UDP-glucuronate 4-epimerase